VPGHWGYGNDGGYGVMEWGCESDDVEAYLLKEFKDGEPTRWFFTRRIPREAVTGLGEGRPASPPPALTYESRAYRYAETNEGTYEDEPGQRIPKTTLEYWDDGRRRNLAVEQWPDGGWDCYHGTYIEPGQVSLEPGGSDSTEEQPRAAPGMAFVGTAAQVMAKVGAKPGVVVRSAAPPAKPGR